jgi:peroxiredoxin
MSLNKRLDFLNETMWRNAGPDAVRTRKTALKNQSGFADEKGAILKHPATVPDATLISADGTQQSLLDIISGKPAVLLFFRGSWCPFSTTSMRSMETIRTDLASHGVAMVGITAQRHITLAAAAQRNALHYPLLTDPEQALTAAMGIRIPVIPDMVEMYQAQGFDLTKLNESADWSLPLEATFLVDADGIIQVANAYPYPNKRMEPEQIRSLMRDLVKSKQVA